MLGGADRVLGPLIGACVVVLLPELLATLGQYRLLFVGLLMLAVLRLAPAGLVGVIAGLLPKARRAATPRQRRDVEGFLATGTTGRGLAVRKLTVSFGGVRAVRDLELRCRARRHHQRHRAQWRRQEHGAQRHLRLLPAR